MQQKVIFIAGLVRSGTTFLELMLCNKYGFVGLGEIAQMIDGLKATEVELLKKPWLDYSKRTCSCGKGIQSCDYWGDIYSHHARLSKKELHEKIIQRSVDIYGAETIIDSSKDISALKYYYENNKDIDTRIIYITRDYRGWVESIQKHLKLNNMADYGSVYHSYRWLSANRNNINYLSRFEDKAIVVHYENLLFDPLKQWERINRYLGASGSGNKSIIHDVYGSRFKNTSNPVEVIKYDNHWMTNIMYNLTYPLTIPVFRYNKWLYENMV